jgi:hypothetical protein
VSDNDTHSPGPPADDPDPGTGQGEKLTEDPPQLALTLGLGLLALVCAVGSIYNAAEGGAMWLTTLMVVVGLLAIAGLGTLVRLRSNN